MADGKVIIDTELNTKDAEKQSKKLGNSLQSGISKGCRVASKGLMAVGTVAVATGGALVKMAKSTADTGDHIDKMSQKLGISAEAYQKWDYVAKISGTSIDSLKMGFKTLTNTIDKANKGDKEAATQFNKLGVSMDDLKNKSKEDIFKDTVKGLQNVKNATERSAMANKLFGRSGMEMGALLNSSNGSIDELMKKAEDYGMVMSDKAVKASAEFKDSLTTMQMTFTGLKNRMMGEFLPSLTQVTDGLALVFKGDTNEGIEKINEGITGFINKMGEIMPKVLEVGGNIIMSLVTAILQNLPQLLTTGTEIALELLKGLISAIPSIISGLLGAISTILNTLTAQLPNTINILVQGLISALGSISKAVPTIVQSGVKLIFALVQGIFSALPTLVPTIIQTGINLILSLAQGLLEGLPTLIDMLPSLIQSVLDSLLNSLPLLINGAIQLVSMLVQNLPTILLSLVSSIPRIISMVVSAIIRALPLLIQGLIGLVLMLVQNAPKIILSLISSLPRIIKSVLNAVINNLPLIIKSLIQLVIMLVKNLPTILLSLIKSAPKIIKMVVVSLIEAIPVLIKGIISMVSTIVKNLPKLLSKVWEFVKTIPSKVWGFIKGIADFGADLVKGIWNGIKDLGKWIWDKIKGFCSGIVKHIKKFFGIKSPSKLMKDQVGKFIAQGIWVGFDENNPMKQINDAVANGVQQLDTNIKMQSVINYDKMVDAFAESGLVVQFNNREVGRMVREFN